MIIERIMLKEESTTRPHTLIAQLNLSGDKYLFCRKSIQCSKL